MRERLEDIYQKRKEYLCYAEEEMRKYQQLSFSQDRVVDGGHYLGFDLHTMWGLYADKGYGVCLVFDKENLNLVLEITQLISIMGI